MTRSNKEYLGDGVYAEFNEDLIKLTAKNGVRILNIIYLEPSVMDALIAFSNKFREK